MATTLMSSAPSPRHCSSESSRVLDSLAVSSDSSKSFGSSAKSVGKLKITAIPSHFSRVELEVYWLDEHDSIICDRELHFMLKAFDAASLLRNVPFKIDEEICDEGLSLHIGNTGRVKCNLNFDSAPEDIDAVIFRAYIFDNLTCFHSSSVQILKYRMELVEVRLTDDISNYDGCPGTHYTNNNSARIKIFYLVVSKDGPVEKKLDLLRFHCRVMSTFLYANGNKIQHKDNANGQFMDITELDCAVKRKRKDEDKTRIWKPLFEERTKELSIPQHLCGVIQASYRLNLFGSHPILKKNYREGDSKFIINLSHPQAISFSIPPFRILTKYHRTPIKNDNEKRKAADDKNPVEHKDKVPSENGEKILQDGAARQNKEVDDIAENELSNKKLKIAENAVVSHLHFIHNPNYLPFPVPHDAARDVSRRLESDAASPAKLSADKSSIQDS